MAEAARILVTDDDTASRALIEQILAEDDHRITTYSDNIGETAFLAFYDLGFVKSHLAANTNKGLIVIAAFHRFENSERPNFLCREFYYRER